MTISSTLEIPLVGLGTWKIPKDQTSDTVSSAISLGYRMIDCACDYGNEFQVGQGIKHSQIPRSQLFVTSKLWNSFHKSNHVAIGLQKTLDDLDLDYLDLYLIHFPISSTFIPVTDRYPPEWSIDGKSMVVSEEKVSLRETWTALEELVYAGKIRFIGVANFNCTLIREILSFCRIKPYVNQVELHPYLTQKKLVSYCEKVGVKVTAYSSFGGLSYIPLGSTLAKETQSLLTHERVVNVSKIVGKTSAQVLLKWATSRGISVIPKSTSVERLKENMDLEFELPDDVLMELDGLDGGIRFNDPGVFADFPIYD